MAAANTDLLMEVGDPGTATTLSAPGYTAGNTSITVGSTSNWATATGVTFAIDEVETVDGVEQQVAGSYNEFVGTVATGTSITNVDWVRGSGDRNYSAGASTRVYIPVSSERENRIVEWGLVEHNQDGTHSDITATSLVTTGDITVGDDLSVTGDTSLTGPLTIKSYDGYIYPTYTPVYASSTSITVAGTDVTAQFPVGTKIVLNQSGLKYFYVTSRSFSTDTTINLTGGSDYTVANAAISGFGYSYDAAPQGFPQWFSYTVAFTNITEGNGTDASYFKMNGNEVVYRIHFTFGSTTSVAGNVGASLPVTASSTGWSSATYAGKGILKDSGTAEYNATLEVSSTTVCSVYVDLVSGSYIIKAQLSSTIPFSWTTNDVISGVVIYRAA